MIGTNGWHETTVTQTVHYTPENCSLDQSTETVTMLMQGKIKQIDFKADSFAVCFLLFMQSRLFQNSDFYQ